MNIFCSSLVAQVIVAGITPSQDVASDRDCTAGSGCPWSWPGHAGGHGPAVSTSAAGIVATCT